MADFDWPSDEMHDFLENEVDQESFTSSSVKPHSIIIRRIRRTVDTKRRTPVACSACKSRKKKCDNLRPCSRCTRLGRAAQCVSWKDSDTNVIEHPIVFNSNTIERYSIKNRIDPRFVAKHDFMLNAIMTLNSCGLRLESVAQILNAIPNSLLSTVRNVFCPVSMQQRAQITEYASSPSDTETEPIEDHVRDELTDCERWESDQTFGYFELIYDKVNTSRWRRVGMNTRYASLHGFHKEELLARYAAGEAELQRTEIDALLFFLFSLKGVLGGDGGGGPREFYSRIYTGSGDSMRPLLVWVTMGNTVTPQGNAKVTVLIKVISAEEYDEAARRTPSACVMYSLGDLRPGRRLLQDFPADARRAVSALGTAPDDAELVRRLADFCLA